MFLKKYMCILASTGFESHILFSSSLNVLEAKGALPNKHSVVHKTIQVFYEMPILI